MNFILYSNLFDFIILIIYFINITIIGILSFKEIKNKKEKKNNDSEKTVINNKGIYIFTIITIILYIIVLIVLFIKLAYKFNFISIFSLLFYLSFLWSALKNRNKNVKSLTYDNKADYVNTILLYLLFFSCNTTSVYINSFASVSHMTKEYLLLIFLFIKLVCFAYCIITNIAIFLSNITIILNKKGGEFKDKIKNKIYRSLEFKFYGFNLSINKKSKYYFILDVPIFFITCPFFLIYNFIMPFFIAVTRYLYEKCSALSKKIDTYLNNSPMIISKTLKISSIISLIIVHWIMIYNSNLISIQTKEFYNLIITVILIPLIYDGIKSNNQSQ